MAQDVTAIRYQKIDAFTASGSAGNPAACLYLGPGQHLDDDRMLAIAREHRGFVSEVVYATTEHDGAVGLSFWSSECEVDFCGHGTIACLYALIRDTPALLAQDEVLLRTRRKGDLTLRNRIREDDAVFITAPAPVRFGTAPGPDAVAAALGLEVAALDGALPIEVIDAGLRTLLVPLRELATEVAVRPDEPGLRAFCLAHDVDIVLAFCLEVATPGRLAHTRVFAPRFGYLEDPATGSGTSALGYYLLDRGLWDGAPGRVEQGGADRVFNEVHLRAPGGVVEFGGRATVRIDGVYLA